VLIGEPTRPLGEFDCRSLIASVAALDDAVWLRDERRQQDYDVHAQTRSLILLFCTGWPTLQVSRASGWELLSADAVPVMDSILNGNYPPGGRILRAMMARLPPGGRIARHKDSHPSFAIAHRIHVPLLTNPDVEFIVGDERVPPRPQFAFELNNHMYHQVANRGTTPRVHFIFDYAPPQPASA
jgi:hypothetical protein